MLDELVDVIETLKSRINEHRSVLQGNEAQTRMSLIDPLLRALGWDTANPALVRPEYVVNDRRADYALMNAQGDVVVFLEAKNLGEQLANHRSQVVAYASELGIRFPALTNGNEWEVYDNSQLVPIEQRRVLNVSIANDPSPKCALQFLLLWHPNMASGLPIEAKEPIVGTVPPTPATSPPTQTPVQNVPVPLDAGWVTLRDFDAKKGGKCPPKVRFPKGDEKDIRNWKDLLAEVAEWLIRDGKLTAAECPIPLGHSGKNCLVNSLPEHTNGRALRTPRELTGPLFLNVDMDATKLVERSRELIEYFEEDPSAVHVQVG